ncbi:MAG: UxaA family hydrolase, partial [Moorellaceae bacterium]
MQKALLLNERDNVAVALTGLKAGETVKVGDPKINLLEPVKAGHKFAVARIEEGGEVIKYGHPIGRATRTILPGQWVHTHNLKSGLEDLKDYAYHPRLVSIKLQLTDKEPFFLGYPRPDGSVGIRNEIWIIPTVGCVNRLAENLADLAARQIKAASLDGIHALTHPYGCSQLGQDHQNTQKLLSSLCHHPNAAGVLVLGLGCENNRIEEFKEVLGDYDPGRVKFLIAQEIGDEIEEGLRLLQELAEQAGRASRAPFPVSELKIGLKCGGSDAFSGITANPLVGLVAEEVVAWGGTAVLTEVPEMFGAETILMDRALDQDLFTRIVELINGWK